MAKPKEQGLFPEQPGGGVQGLFDQSKTATPGAQHAAAKAQPAVGLPGGPATSSAGDEPGKARPKKRHRFGLWRFAPHVIALFIAIGGLISKSGGDASTFHAPTIPRISGIPGHAGSSQDTPAFKTMRITSSGSTVANGVYRARAAQIDGAGTKSDLEFAIAGRGSKQRVVYYAGVRVRDASCDGAPKSSAGAGLFLYDDELTSEIRGRTVRATSDGGVALRGVVAGDHGSISGTFRFHAYSGCSTGGHFTFRATRTASNKPFVAPLVWALGG